MKKHSVLVIGCGSIGERHLRCLLKTERVAVTACDNSEPLRRRMATVYAVPAVADWEAAMTSGRFDAAVICTPAPWHIPMASRALETGLHVLVEKPLSQSLVGVDALLQAHARSDRKVSVAYNYHIYPFLTDARTFLRSGELGPVRQAVTASGQPFYLLRPGYATTYYRDHRTGGGAIQDALTHAANWVESVLGPTVSVLCDCAHLELPGVEVEDTVHLSARHEHALASYTLNQFQAPNETTIQFNNLRGSVRIELHNQRWGVFRAGQTEWTWHQPPILERDAHSIAQCHAFLDQIEGAPTRLCSLEAAAHTLRFNLAALASAESGMRIRCDEIPSASNASK